MFAVHELALAECVIRQITDRLGTAQVVRVRLEIGRLAAVMPEALRFSFQLCIEGTSLGGAALEIESADGAELLIREVEVI